MKFQFSLILVLIIVMLGCQKNATKTEYQSVMVKVYTGHDSYTVVEPIFETFFEQVLLKEAYNEGATFETVMEQVLDVEGYTQIKITTKKETTQSINK